MLRNTNYESKNKYFRKSWKVELKIFTINRNKNRDRKYRVRGRGQKISSGVQYPTN